MVTLILLTLSILCYYRASKISNSYAGRENLHKDITVDDLGGLLLGGFFATLFFVAFMISGIIQLVSYLFM